MGDRTCGHLMKNKPVSLQNVLRMTSAALSIVRHAKPGAQPSGSTMAFVAPTTTSLRAATNATLVKNWWILALRGLLAIVFGIAAFVMPGATILSILLIFAAFSFVDGVFNIALAARRVHDHQRAAPLFLNGIFGVLFGVLVMLWPITAVLAFVFMIGFWALVSGGFMLWTAAFLHIDHGRWLMLLSGLVSIAYGVLLFASPLIGALVLTWWVGAYAIILGIALLFLAFRLRRHR
jgi:uncharacterized membrane protein HdeD (DUF308 family)